MRDANIMEESPILIFGLPRSGTTWIGKLFDSHPDIIYRHEPDSLEYIEEIPFISPSKDKKLTENALGYLQKVRLTCNTTTCGKLPIFPKRYRSRIAQHLYKWSLTISLLLDKAGVNTHPPILFSSEKNSSSRLVWKSIESIGRLGLFLSAHPKAYGIHIVRHPCGYISSVLRGEAAQKFKSSSKSSEDWDLFEKLLMTETSRNHGLTMDIIRSLHPIERLAWRWVICNEYAYMQNHHNPRYRLVYYEEVCTNPKESIKDIFYFCNLPWDSQTEEFIEKSCQPTRDGYYSIYKNPRLTASRWESDLTQEQIYMITNIAKKSDIYRMALRRFVWN